MVKGNCYENAIHKFVDLQKSGHDAVIVHGHVEGQGSETKGKRFGHAWVEVGNKVYDAETNTTWTKDDYYRIGKIDEDKTYEYDKYLVSYYVSKTEHCGPWELEPTDFEKEATDESE